MYNPSISNKERIDNMKEENRLRRVEYYQMMDKVGDFPLVVLKDEIIYWDRYIRWCEDNW